MKNNKYKFLKVIYERKHVAKTTYFFTCVTFYLLNDQNELIRDFKQSKVLSITFYFKKGLSKLKMNPSTTDNDVYVKKTISRFANTEIVTVPISDARCVVINDEEKIGSFFSYTTSRFVDFVKGSTASSGRNEFFTKINSLLIDDVKNNQSLISNVKENFEFLFKTRYKSVIQDDSFWNDLIADFSKWLGFEYVTDVSDRFAEYLGLNNVNIINIENLINEGNSKLRKLFNDENVETQEVSNNKFTLPKAELIELLQKSFVKLMDDNRKKSFIDLIVGVAREMFRVNVNEKFKNTTEIHANYNNQFNIIEFAHIYEVSNLSSYLDEVISIEDFDPNTIPSNQLEKIVSIFNKIIDPENCLILPIEMHRAWDERKIFIAADGTVIWNDKKSISKLAISIEMLSKKTISLIEERYILDSENEPK